MRTSETARQARFGLWTALRLCSGEPRRIRFGRIFRLLSKDLRFNTAKTSGLVSIAFEGNRTATRKRRSGWVRWPNGA